MAFLSSFQVSRLRKHISLLQLQRFGGHHKDLTPEEKGRLVDHCKHHYKEGLNLGKDLATTVNQHSDFYIILASHLKMELFQDTGEWGNPILCNLVAYFGQAVMGCFLKEYQPRGIDIKEASLGSELWLTPSWLWLKTAGV